MGGKMNHRKAERIRIALTLAGLLFVVPGLLRDALLLFYIGLVMMFAGMAVSARWERCPHCHKWLGLNEGDFCRYCKKLLNTPEGQGK